jgi:hypothetical protein
MTNMQTSLSLLIVWPSILNPIINFSRHLWLVKWNTLYVIHLPCAFHFISSNVDARHAPTLINKWYDPLYIIMWPCWFIDLDLTCFSPLPSSIGVKSCSRFTATRSIAPKPPTCPSRLQPVHQAKPCIDLFHLSHMTPCHVSYAMSSFITYVSLATYPSHFHLHGMCCSHTCTCGLITCVFHLDTY